MTGELLFPRHIHSVFDTIAQNVLTDKTSHISFFTVNFA